MDVLLMGVIYTLAPVGLLYVCKKSSWLNRFGAVGLAYALGIVLANVGVVSPKMKPLQDTLTSATIALALPLLLFSINIRQWSRLAFKTGLAVVFGIFAVMITVALGHLVFRGVIDDCWSVSGLMVGVYIGGTANMAAIMKALNGDANTFILINAYDIILCFVYLFFLITKAQTVIGKVLVPFKHAKRQSNKEAEVDDFEGWGAYKGIGKRAVLYPLMLAIVLALVVVAVSLFIAQFFPVDYQMAGTILCITAMSITLSMVPAVNKVEKTFQSGMYLILMFCFVVGSLSDFSRFTLESVYLALFIVFVIIGSLVLQIAFSMLFKIDTDTTIITSTAFIFSAPFVPTVASALKNKEIILSGVTIGIIGYALGNFLGISLAYFLKMWL